MVYFRVEVTDHVGFVVYDETYCTYQSAKKCFDDYLNSCDSLCYEVSLLAFSVSVDFENSVCSDLPS